MASHRYAAFKIKKLWLTECKEAKTEKNLLVIKAINGLVVKGLNSTQDGKDKIASFAKVMCAQHLGIRLP